MEMDLSLLNISEEETQQDSSPDEESTGVDPSPAETVDEPAEETQETEPESESSPELTDREKALLERLEKVTGERLDQSPQVTVPEEQSQQAIVEHNFLEGLDIDEVLSSSENFNKLLVSVYAKGMQEASKLSAENIMRNLPSVISQYVSQHVTMSEMVKDFYSSNPDLAGVKRTVAAVANEIANDDPNLTTPQVFEKTATRVRELLKLKKPTLPSAKLKPAFVQQRGRQQTPQLQGLAREIEELLS
jgi:hypothetical protein